MSKIWTIAKREFKIRALNKKFLLITFLTPLLIGVFVSLLGVIMTYEEEKEMSIALIDKNQFVHDSINQWGSIKLIKVAQSEEVVKNSLGDQFSALLVIPSINFQDTIQPKINLYSKEQIDLVSISTLKSNLSKTYRIHKLKELNLTSSNLKMLDDGVQIDTKNVADDSNMSSEFASIFGIALGFFLYLLLIINGTMIMKSVMEEKTNRIVEVMLSTVKPTQLMYGKILGTGAVGLFQILMWLIITPIMVSVFGYLFLGGQQPDIAMGSNVGSMDPDMAQGVMNEVMAQIASINWWIVIPSFILYFLMGYLLYASLFAAVGSTMGDDQGEGQSLTMLIITPLIFSCYIAFSAARSPNSPLAFWSSIFPLTSPVVMPSRLAMNPPIWEILLSLVILFASVIFLGWLSGKIYRIGILMYGKKASLNEIIKWLK